MNAAPFMVISLLDWYRLWLARRACSKYAPFLAGFRNVIGVVPARARVKGRPGRLIPQVCLRVYLKASKQRHVRLRPEEIFHRLYEGWHSLGRPDLAHTLPDFDVFIPRKLGRVQTDVVCLPKGWKAYSEYPSGVDGKQYDWLGAGMAVSGASIRPSFGSSAWPVVAKIGDRRALCITSNGHVSPRKGEKFYQAGEVVGANVGVIYPPDVYPAVAPADFALAELNGVRPTRAEIVELGSYELDYHKAKVGMRVTKRGVTRFGRAGFVTVNAVSDGPFDVGPVDYGDGALGIVGNSYDIIAESPDMPHAGPGCSGSGENHADDFGLLYPAGELYAGGQDDQGLDHTIFYDWSAPGGPIDRFGLTFDLSNYDPPDGDEPPEEPSDCEDEFNKDYPKCLTLSDVWDMIFCLVDKTITYWICALGELAFQKAIRKKKTMQRTLRGKSGRKYRVTLTITEPKKT